ncbi:MAG TPA: BON domain-containing protein [Microvirga sp.]|jgi:hypothetical protein|nr:BON domain-containing protein [Microvirga sp.]
MADTRRPRRDPFDDDNGYGDVPNGAVGTRGRGREYPDGYGAEVIGDERGGVVDDGRGGPRDDAGTTPRHHSSGYGAFGHIDRNDRERTGDERLSGFRGRGPKGYQRSDERIREDVCERLTDDPIVDASDIDIVVADREVTLNGFVEHRDARRRAEDIAEHVSGVAHVQNNLRVRGPSVT